MQPPLNPCHPRYESCILGDDKAEINWPSGMTPEDYQDFEDWIQLVLRKAKRSIAQPNHSGGE